MYQAWLGTPSNPDDIILLTKQFMHTARLSQRPILFAPAELQVGMQSGCPTKCMPRKAFPERKLKEFTRTAKVIAEDPWQMQRASSYLKERGLRQRSREP